MDKSPIRQLFDTLITDETVTVIFDSIHDLNITKIRLHQIRKDTDKQLATIGEESIFGDRSIIFTPLDSLTYKISIEQRNAASRARFKILGPSNENIPTSVGDTEI